MSTIQQLVGQLGTGWSIVGNGQPVEETQTGTYTDPTDVGAAPQVMTRGTGRYYVIVKDDQGHQRALFLKADPIKGGLVVPQTGVTDRADSVTGKTPSNVYTGNLANLSWAQAGPVGDVPQEPKTPTATAQLDKIDADGNDATKSGKPAVELRDPKTGTTVQIPKDPAGSVTAVGDTMYVIKPDGSSTPVVGPDGKPLTKPKDKSQFNVPGMGLVEYDPSKSGSDAYNVVIATPKGVQASQLKPEVRNGITFMPVDDGNGGVVWTEAKQADGSPLPTDVTYTMASNDPRSPDITLIDNQGNSKQVSKGPNWKPPASPAAGQALTPDTTSPFVVTIGDNGQPVFTENKNRQSINEAQQALIQQLGIKVATGQMSEKEAQDVITNATQAMTAQAAMLNAQANQQQNIQQGATGALNAISQGAQTGAGLLQNRVTAATGALNNILGIAGGAKNLMSMPAGLGEQLVGGLQGWATELGGGQDVYNSAANLVRRADPGSALGGDASTAYAALGQMLQKYRDLTGQPHPAEVAAAQPQQNTGFTAPAAGAATPVAAAAGPPAPAPATAPDWYTQWQNRQAADVLLQNQQRQLMNGGQPSIINPATTNMPNFGAPTFVAPVTVAPPPATVTA